MTEYIVKIVETTVYSRSATVDELEEITGYSVADFEGNVEEMVVQSSERSSEVWEWLERYSDIVGAEVTVEKVP